MIHGAHQQQGAEPPRKKPPASSSPAAASPQTDVVLEARTVPGAGEFPIRKMPSPRDARSSRPAPDVAMRAGCSCRPTTRCSYHAGQYVEFILRDGARRSYSMANAPHTQASQPRHRTAHPPHARRQVHRPRVQRDEGEGDPARRRPVRQLLPARGLRQADGPARLGHRLRADQGDHRAHAVSRAASGRPCCTGAAAARPTCTWTTGSRARRADMPHLRYVPVLSEPCPRTTGPAAPASSTRR